MKYVCYYDLINNKSDNRRIVLSAVNKINYIISALQTSYDSELTIVSASETLNTKYSSKKEIRLGDKLNLILFGSLGRKNLVTKFIDKFFIKLQLFRYLMKHAEKNETVILYHSPALIKTMMIAKKLKGFRLVLELEEIYADVANDSKLRKKELALCQAADAFIFPTQLLDKAVNTKRKPAIIIHGTYQVEPDRNVRLFDKEHIHCVYAGTLDPRKGGGTAAVAAAFLPSNYHIHIIGFGNDKDKTQLENQIADLSRKCKATVSFDGLKSGEDYIQYVQSCDIGLSTQNPDASFNSTSFPSKVLSYLANGLHVVSIRIPAIEQSSVGDILSYYDTQTPEEIAKAILAIDLEDAYNSRARIASLDSAFCSDLLKVIRE